MDLFFLQFTSVVSPVLESIDNITKTAQGLLQQLGEQQELDSQKKEDTISPQLEVSTALIIQWWAWHFGMYFA